MKQQQFCGPRSGKLVCQLPGDVTFAYDLHLRRSRDHWKGLIKDYNSEMGPGNDYSYLLSHYETKRLS